ncbi:MAG TPA: 3-oxoacyl-ACP reductase [Solirubrobacteraceae bacterium]|nr:3-oxoacyl-ACP reductase [Solirubrobacteraceae bacterium]
MADRYQQFVDSPPGRFMTRRLGLPQPAPLRRGPELFDGPVLLGGGSSVRDVLTRTGVDIRDHADAFDALIFDATRIANTRDLRDVFNFFQPVIRDLAPSGRAIVVGTGEGVAQRALEGFVRSLGKELRAGATAQLVYAEPDADLESTLRFLLSGRSAYVSGQVIRVRAAVRNAPEDWSRPLAGLTAAVTGASRGIGAAIAEVLARDGAQVICVDVPAQGEDLTQVANRVGGSALQLDITSDRAPGVLAERGAGIVVHNAGITRDKTLARMSEDQWDSVLAVNLESIERINAALLAAGDVKRIVCVSSVSGIAGNRGQTNYGTSKAGVIGVVDALADDLAKRQGTINAVAPGFIETRMTAAMPLATREAGRRMNSLAQGGLPIDVAETVAWFASPGSAGVNGNVVRVCGQSLIGA